MMRDVETRQDLETVLEAFYKKVFADDLLSHFFTVVIPVDLKTHLPLITDFWEAVVLGRPGYRKNVMDVHQHIHAKAPIEPAHFERWLLLFTQTLAAQFRGPNATLMTQRAASVAALMQLKLNGRTLIKPST